MLLRVIAAKAQIARDGFAVERKAAARQRARSERQHVDARARLLEPLAIAREHFEIRQQIVRPEHRLRPPQMRVAGNHGIADICRPARAAHPSTPASPTRSVSIALAQPEPHIERHLLVAAAAGVDLVGQRADLLFSLRMTSVWTSSSVAPSKNLASRASRPISSNASNRSVALGGGQDAHALQRARKRLRALDIGVDQSPVEMQRPGEALEDFRRPSSNARPRASSPLFLQRRRATWIGSPIRLMNPSASFWSYSRPW